MQVELDVSALEGRMAGVEGVCTISRRSLCSQATLLGQAAGQQLPGARAWSSTTQLYFKGGELGVRWMPRVTGKDLL